MAERGHKYQQSRGKKLLPVELPPQQTGPVTEEHLYKGEKTEGRAEDDILEQAGAETDCRAAALIEDETERHHHHQENIGKRFFEHEEGKNRALDEQGKEKTQSHQ